MLRFPRSLDILWNFLDRRDRHIGQSRIELAGEFACLRNFLDRKLIVSSESSIRFTQELLWREGIFGGVSSGAALSVAVRVGRQHTLLFGDMTGWFYSLSAETGKLLWKVHIETHDSTRLTGAPVA